MNLEGVYFFPHTSRPVHAFASLSPERNLIIVDAAGTVVAQAPFKAVVVSQRLGRLRRRLKLPDAGHFETSDNDGVDAMLHQAGRLRSGGLIDRLERSVKWVVVALLLAVLSVYLLVAYGFPAAAVWLARETPASVATIISEQTLQTLDRLALSPSKLKPIQMQKARTLFARVSTLGARGAAGYRLLFRHGGVVGPNALSLPDGTVVMTDELYVLVQRDDELEGVFGHEIAHADRRHGLQMLYEGSLIPAAIVLVTGDPSQLGQIAAALPAILIETSYSRRFEQQADDDSAVMLKRIGGDPAALGEFLERMDRKLCGQKGCSASWLGSHPATADRAARLRNESGRSPNGGQTRRPAPHG